jgi:hypothetical protein
LLSLNANYYPNQTSYKLNQDVSHSHQRVLIPDAALLALRPFENRDDEPKSKNEVFNSRKVIKPSWESNLIPEPVPSWTSAPKQSKPDVNVPCI